MRQLPAVIVWVQPPVPLHVSVVHASLSSQLYAVPLQTPARQISLTVHAFASLHDVPSAFVGFEHAPVPGSHTPAAWHWSNAVQVIGLPALHLPAPSQVSAPLHGLPSLQIVPDAADG